MLLRTILLTALALECPMCGGFQFPVTRRLPPSSPRRARIPASLVGIRARGNSAVEDQQKQGWLCRRMGLSDVSRVARLDKECYGGQGLWTAGMYEEELAGDRNILLVLEVANGQAGQDGELVGVGALSHILDEGSITNMAVCPSSRRQGLGSMILSGILSRARHLGLDHLSLEVSQESDILHAPCVQRCLAPYRLVCANRR